VDAAANRGTSFGAPTAGEVDLAAEVARRIESVDMLRMTSSGTEATMTALRLARAATGRERIVKFAGAYHGHVDGLLAEAGSGLATQGIPSSPGVPAGAAAATLVAEWNADGELPLSEEVAAIVLEPIPANMGVVAPRDGFLEQLRRQADEHGALLIFDEVITGFRVARGGASTLLGVTPDLWCFGKVVGGGLPLAAFGGRRDVMEQLAPIGPVYQAGTLSGNPVATAAGLAVLSLLDDAAYDALSVFARRLATGLSAAAIEVGLEAQVPVAGPLVGIFFGMAPVRDCDGVRAAAATGLYPPIMHGLLSRAVAIAPGAYEVIFPSLAHGDLELATTLAAFAEAASQALGARQQGSQR
jgi:glutamate-1-semialdehyde 2,1-aminomutase